MPHDTARIKANRENARASTGPRTARGKSISAQNARRHGLSLPVISDPVLSEEVELLAREIAGEPSDDNIYRLARRIAEAQVDLLRVRHTRHQLLSNKLDEPYYESRASTRAQMAIIFKLLKPNAPAIPMGTLTKFPTSTPKGARKFALILSQETKQLLALDRYERRALSRRKFAMRELDALRRRTAT